MAKCVNYWFNFILKKHFKNVQRSRDATAQKIANTSRVGKSNNYYEYVYTPPYNNTL